MSPAGCFRARAGCEAAKGQCGNAGRRRDGRVDEELNTIPQRKVDSYVHVYGLACHRSVKPCISGGCDVRPACGQSPTEPHNPKAAPQPAQLGA